MIGFDIDPDGGVKTDDYMVIHPVHETGYATTDYRLVTTKNSQDIDVYQIRNVKYGVTEYEDHLLHRILTMMQSMQAELSKSLASYVPPFLTLVEQGDEDKGESSLH